MGHLSSCAASTVATKLLLCSVGRDQLHSFSYAFGTVRKPSPFSYKRSITCKISTQNFEAQKNGHHNPRLLDTLSMKQQEQTSLFVNTLLEWNQRMNLTAVTERCAVMERHVEDSLALLPIIENAYKNNFSTMENVKLKLVDVGSGAGLPGIILAIARPDWQITLIESLQKRCFFLEHVVDVSCLSNAQVVRIRAEDAGQNPDFREKYDIAVARAVADMRILVEYCLPLVRVGGLLVAAKGYNPQEEVENAKKAIRLMGASVLQLCSVTSEGPYGQRTAVLCLKNRPTPAKYPRHPGIPAKKPL